MKTSNEFIAAQCDQAEEVVEMGRSAEQAASAMPDCWVVVKNGRILGTHDEPAHIDGLNAVRYVPAIAQPVPPAVIDALKLSAAISVLIAEATKGADKEWREFAEEMATQYGFTYVDDDATILQASTADVVNMMSVLGYRKGSPAVQPVQPAAACDSQTAESDAQATLTRTDATQTTQPAAQEPVAIRALEQIHNMSGAEPWEYRQIALTALAQLEAPAQPVQTAQYDQTALELCDVCGWRTLIPGDCCLNCERDKGPNYSETPAPDIHSCSYFCNKPECIKAQRDEMREAATAAAQAPQTTHAELLRNVTNVERRSDQSVTIVFTICRAASEFERAAIAASKGAA